MIKCLATLYQDFDAIVTAFDTTFGALDLKLDLLKTWTDTNIESVLVRQYEGSIENISLFDSHNNVIDSEDYYVKVVAVNLTDSDTLASSD